MFRAVYESKGLARPEGACVFFPSGAVSDQESGRGLQGRLRSAPSTRGGASPERGDWEAWSQRRLRGGSWREARFPFVRVRHFARQRQWRRQRRLGPLIGFRSPVVEPISAGSEPGERGTVSVRSQYPAAQSRPQRPDWRVSLTTQERPRLPSSPGSRAELSRAGRLAAPV